MYINQDRVTVRFFEIIPPLGRLIWKLVRGADSRQMRVLQEPALATMVRQTSPLPFIPNSGAEDDDEDEDGDSMLDRSADLFVYMR